MALHIKSLFTVICRLDCFEFCLHHTPQLLGFQNTEREAHAQAVSNISCLQICFAVLSAKVIINTF